MARGYRQPGETLEWIAPAGGVVSGVPVLIGTPGKLVVPLGSALAGQPFRCATSAVYSLPKAAGLAITNGDTLYWDDTAKVLNKTNTNTAQGICAKSALAADSRVEVLMTAF